jgi:thioredoxin 1
MSVKTADNTAQFDEMTANGLAVVDLWAPWCGPCVAYAPVFARVADTVAGALFVKVNVDEVAEVAGRFGVMSIPTTLVLRDGELVGKLVGAVSETQLRDTVTAA